MSQTWNIPIAATDTLSASRPKINDAFEALRTSFSGMSAPGSPVAGQWFLNTSENNLYFYNGTAWVILGDVTKDHLGMLSRWAGPSQYMLGDIYMNTHQIKGLAAPTDSGDAVALSYLQSNYLPLSGATMTGDITMGANNVLIDHNPTADDQAARKAYVDTKVAKAGDSMSGNLDMGGNLVTNLGTATNASDATSKSYVDGKFDTGAGHDHDGTDSKRVEGSYLASSGISQYRVIEADGSGTVTWGLPVAGIWHSYTSQASGSYTTPGGWVDILSLTISAPNSGLPLMFEAFAKLVSGVDHGGDHPQRIYEPNGGIDERFMPNWEQSGGGSPPPDGWLYWRWFVEPTSGSNTYYWQVWSDEPSGPVDYRDARFIAWLIVAR